VAAALRAAQLVIDGVSTVELLIVGFDGIILMWRCGCLAVSMPSVFQKCVKVNGYLMLRI